MFFFLPTGSSAESTRQPRVTIALALACIGVFGWTQLWETRPPDEVAFQQAQAYAADRPYLVDQAYPGRWPEPEVLRAEQGEWQRLIWLGGELSGGLARRLSLVPARGLAQVGWVTHLFVHFDLLHLMGNLLFLWLVGPLLEDAWGRRRFLLFYLLAGVAAAVVQFRLAPGSGASLGGASGAIAGCMGAFAVLFALTRIRFHYFIWFFRAFWGSVNVPAWACGLLWFGREVADLRLGGAPGVATGAHVGGFVVGGITAFLLRAWGLHRLSTQAGVQPAERGALEMLFAEATAAVGRGDYEAGREALLGLQRSARDYPGLGLLLAEIDLRTHRGQARLERALKPLLAAPHAPAMEETLSRLWPAIDPQGFTQAFAWALARRLRSSGLRFAPSAVDQLLEAVAAGAGPLAARAQAARVSAPVAPAPVPSAPPGQAGPRILPVRLVAVSSDGVQVSLQGVERRVPFAALESVHAGLVREAGRQGLWVDLVLKPAGTRPRRALRLSGADPGVPSLFPAKPVPEAWQTFIRAVRRTLGVQSVELPWREFPSVEALAQSWSLKGQRTSGPLGSIGA